MHYDLFCEMPCLAKSPILGGLNLQKKWFKNTDKRYLSSYLQRFLDINRDAFDFLGIKREIFGADQSSFLEFTSNNFIGTIPLISPENGKPIGDFAVTPRFGIGNRYEQYSEILYLLDSNISLDFFDGTPLTSERNFRPPFYLEAIKFLGTLETLTNHSWRKFNNEGKFLSTPTGQVDWDRYAQSSYKVENRLEFPVHKNLLSESHIEYSQIRFVFDICKTELLSSNTPFRLKNKFSPLISSLEEKLYFHQPKQSTEIPIHSFDFPYVKDCKVSANTILNSKFLQSIGWRVDFSVVFEKFIQHIFHLAAKESLGHLTPNPKFQARYSPKFAWNLDHLEPDAILKVGEKLIFIDAKYKSHLLNKYAGDSLSLKDDHRSDLHQVIAYSAFSENDTKYGFLCYPSFEVEASSIDYVNPYNNNVITIFIFGVPVEVDAIPAAKKEILNILSYINRT
ncbi:MAG TPA: hypothetical protein VFO76_10940 [Candidatus Kapabacteria bacterium]|nr:hypothetical protein [Candidatus Kapabacteria bacterium]